MGRIPYFDRPFIEGFPKETIFLISFYTKQGFHFDKIVNGSVSLKSCINNI